MRGSARAKTSAWFSILSLIKIVDPYYQNSVSTFTYTNNKYNKLYRSFINSELIFNNFLTTLIQELVENNKRLKTLH